MEGGLRWSWSGDDCKIPMGSQGLEWLAGSKPESRVSRNISAVTSTQTGSPQSQPPLLWLFWSLPSICQLYPSSLDHRALVVIQPCHPLVTPSPGASLHPKDMRIGFGKNMKSSVLWTGSSGSPPWWRLGEAHTVTCPCTPNPTHSQGPQAI